MAIVTIALATLWASCLNLWCACMKCAGQHPSCMYTTGLDSYMYAIPAPRIWSTQRWTGLQTCKWRLPLQESVDYNAVWCTMNEISHDLFPCIIINSNLPMLKCTLWCWSQPGLKPKQRPEAGRLRSRPHQTGLKTYNTGTYEEILLHYQQISFTETWDTSWTLIWEPSSLLG